MSVSNRPLPKASRPYIKDYGIPTSEDGLLPWSHVTERMAKPRNYWLATAGKDGRPHSMPSWGVWVDETFYFGGGGWTRKARNIAANPAVVIHLESGDDVVIFEGTAEEITDKALQTRIDDAYEAKYGIRHGTPVWALRPRVVFAWTKFPDTTTRWVFEP